MMTEAEWSVHGLLDIKWAINDAERMAAWESISTGLAQGTMQSFPQAA